MERRRLAIYDGRDCLGYIIARGAKCYAFLASRKRLGTYPSIKVACAAITAAHEGAS